MKLFGFTASSWSLLDTDDVRVGREIEQSFISIVFHIHFIIIAEVIHLQRLLLYEILLLHLGDLQLTIKAGESWYISHSLGYSLLGLNLLSYV